MLINIKEEFEEDQRIDLFLSEYFEDYSRSKLTKLIKAGLVKVNDKEVKASYPIKLNDVIYIDLDDLKIKALEPEDRFLEIIYEDEDLAIINKPIAMLSHPTATIRTGTLVNVLLSKFDSLSVLNGEDRQGIVHRLDHNTSGLMIIAKTNLCAEKLVEMFKSRTIIKRYRAITLGNFEEKEGVLEFPIGRNPRNGKLMAVVEDGKYAKTSYKVICEVKGYSYLNLDLHTGRTHQIRVHLSHINRPILGDPDYGGKRGEFSIDHQLLQAFYLEFIHPISNKLLKFELDESSEIEKYRKVIFKEQPCIQEQKL